MKYLHLITAAAAIIVAAPADAATIFTFDEANSFVRVTNQQSFCLGCNVSVSMSRLPSFTLGKPSDTYSFDFANFVVSPGLGVGKALIEAQLAFRDPFSATAGASANGKYVRLGGWLTPGVTAGSLTWDNPSQIISANDGTRYSVAFGDISRVGFGGRATSRVTVSLLSSAVPEPSTWMMMIAGFGLAGYALRRRPKMQTKVAFS